MWKIFIWFIMIFPVWNTYGNSLEVSEKVFYYLDVDELPRFSKGNVFEYIYSNIKYPAEANIQGSIIVSFIITKDGNVENIKLEKKLYPESDKYVQELLCSMPSWTPGKKDGVAVNTRLLISINFTIQS